MAKKILVINGGSSSIKFKLYDDENLELIASGICERIFVDGRFHMTYFENNNIKKEAESSENFTNHDAAIECLLSKLLEYKVINNLDEILGIGHRIVQGSCDITESVIIDNDVEKIIEKNIDLAPLHNKPELDIIRIMKNKIPNIKNIGVFDSAFHATIPEINSTYAIPESWRKNLKIKRFGAHGTSYRYITEKMESILNKKKVNLIICHLGNGASICAVKDSISINTSMGITPLEGLIMGTRSGDVDPSIFRYVSTKLNIDAAEIDRILNNESGVKALCGFSDFRDITARAEKGNIYDFTLDLFSKRVADYIVRYTNDLQNKVDALVLCGGIGENVPVARKKILEKLYIGHYHFDEKINDQKVNDVLKISYEKCKYSKKIYVVKTDEEIKIASDVKRLVC